MRKILLITMVILSVSVFSGCLLFTDPSDTSVTINKVAIVSFSVSGWGGAIRTGDTGGTSAAELMRSTVAKMLQNSEAMLANKWSVVDVSSFIKNPTYLSLQSTMRHSLIVPEVSGQEMAVFTDVSSEIKIGAIDPSTAMDLCKALNVDGVALIFSEWTTNTDGVVPMTRAVTKNVFTIWDRNGQLATKKRVDMMGRKALGLNGFKAVNEDTLGEWQDSFNRAMVKILDSI